MENNKDIDDLFKDLVESSEMDHSNKVWDSLENHLEKKSNDRNKVIIFRLRLALGIVLILFGTLASYYIFNPKETGSKSLAILEQVEAKKNVNTIEKSNVLIKHDTNENLSSIKNSENLNSFTSKNNELVNKVEKQTHLGKTNSLNLLAFKKSKPLGNSNVVSNKNNITNTQDKFSGLAIENNSESIMMNTVAKNREEEVAAKSIIVDTSNVVIKSDSINQVNQTATTASILSKERLDSIQKKQFKNRLALSVYFSPDITMKYLKDNDDTDHQDEGDYDDDEVSDFSYNTGLLVGYDVSKNWSIKFGGSYAYISQTIKPKTVYAKTGIDGSVHYQFNTTYGTSELPSDQTPPPVIGDSVNINSNSVQSLQVLGIPLFAKYQINRNKFSYYAQGGISFNYLIGEKLIVETQNKSETIKHIQGLNEYYFGGILGLGVSYNPTKRFSVLFEPTLKGAITPINKNTPITTRPISFGLALGLGWHF